MRQTRKQILAAMRRNEEQEDREMQAAEEVRTMFALALGNACQRALGAFLETIRERVELSRVNGLRIEGWKRPR